MITKLLFCANFTDLTNFEKVENTAESDYAIPLLERTHLATKGETTASAESPEILQVEVLRVSIDSFEAFGLQL